MPVESDHGVRNSLPHNALHGDLESLLRFNEHCGICNKMKDDQDKTKRCLLGEIYLATDYEYLSSYNWWERVPSERACCKHNASYYNTLPIINEKEIRKNNKPTHELTCTQYEISMHYRGKSSSSSATKSFLEQFMA